MRTQRSIANFAPRRMYVGRWVHRRSTLSLVYNIFRTVRRKSSVHGGYIIINIGESEDISVITKGKTAWVAGPKWLGSGPKRLETSVSLRTDNKERLPRFMDQNVKKWKKSTYLWLSVSKPNVILLIFMFFLQSQVFFPLKSLTRQ